MASAIVTYTLRANTARKIETYFLWMYYWVTPVNQVPWPKCMVQHYQVQPTNCADLALNIAAMYTTPKPCFEPDASCVETSELLCAVIENDATTHTVRPYHKLLMRR